VAELKTCRITAKAGTFVAGRRNPGTGKTIDLTPEAARYALIAGEIEDPAKADAGKSGEAAPAAIAEDADVVPADATDGGSRKTKR